MSVPSSARSVFFFFFILSFLVFVAACMCFSAASACFSGKSSLMEGCPWLNNALTHFPTVSLALISAARLPLLLRWRAATPLPLPTLAIHRMNTQHTTKVPSEGCLSDFPPGRFRCAVSSLSACPLTNFDSFSG